MKKMIVIAVLLMVATTCHAEKERRIVDLTFNSYVFAEQFDAFVMEMFTQGKIYEPTENMKERRADLWTNPRSSVQKIRDYDDEDNNKPGEGYESVELYNYKPLIKTISTTEAIVLEGDGNRI